MSKDQTTQPTLFQEDSPVNHSALQENGEEKMMTATSGMKLLELLPKQNQNGLLEKMLKELLTSPMVQSCNRYNKTWKKRVSKSNVLLFQLQVSVLGIKEKESGLSDAMFPTPTQFEDRTPPHTTHKMNEKNFQKKMSNLASKVRYQTMYQTPTTQDARIGPNNIGGNKHRMKRGSIALADQILFQTPTATEIPMRSKEAMEKRKKYRESIGRKTVPHGNLLEQIQMMYPTPVVSDNSLETIEKWKQRQKIKKEQGINLHFKLCHHVQMYPTPTQDSASERTKKYNQGGLPLPLAVKMYPTPTAGCEEGGEQSDRVEQTKSGGFVLRKKNKPDMTFGAKLSDAMLYLEKKILPTPTARDYKDAAYQPNWKESRDKSLPREILKNNKPGGKLNPHFVEFLMAYPMNWTKVDPTE